MKQHYISLLALAILAIAACQKQSINELPENNSSIVYNEDGSYEYTVSAAAPVPDATKSDYDNSGNFSWSAGDAISVLFHHPTEGNKFFTLTTQGSGKSVFFRGTIDAGYTIGASDGTSENKKIWVLFPASESHTYTPGSYPKFDVPAETDLTARFSANLPMYAVNADDGAISFSYLACAYKFTVTNIDATKAPKLRVVVTNKNNAALSGSIAMGSNYLKFNDSDVSNGASKTISFVCPVTYDSDPSKGTAMFYVSTRAYQSYFRPSIQINNFSTDFPIKSFDAPSVAPSLGFGTVQPISLDVNDGEYFFPAIAIDGDYSDWSEIGGTSTPDEICKLMKATSDKYYYYFYLVSDATKRALNDGGKPYDFGSGYYYLDFDLDNNPETGDYTDDDKETSPKYEAVTYIRLFKSDCTTITLADNPPYISTSKGVSSSGVSYKGSVADGLMHFEIKIPRANLPAVASGQTIRIHSWRSKGGSSIDYTFNVE